MRTLPVADERHLETKSSIGQAGGETIAVYRAGEYIPIIFDHIDYIDCGKIISHKVIISNDMDYIYPTAHVDYLSDKYVTFSKTGVEEKPLPCWFGDGVYREYVEKDLLLNFSGEALGTRNVENVDVGLHYVEAIRTLC